MSRRLGLLEELQTDQERDLQHTDVVVLLDDDATSDDSYTEKQQNKTLKQLPRFLLKNQINLDNAFQVDLPDDIHLALNPNFLKSSVYLLSLATLYGIRVDSTLRDSFKVKCGLLRIHGVNTHEDDELDDQQQDKERAVAHSKQLSKKKIAHYGLTTLDSGALEQRQYETVQINPFFHQVSKRMDLTSLASMLTYRPLYSDELEMIIDPEQLVKTTKSAPQHQSVKIEFQFQPPSSVDYDQYLSSDMMQDMQEETMFGGFSRLKHVISSDSRKFKIKVTRPLQQQQQQVSEKVEVKSSEHEQSQLDWNQFLDVPQYQEQEEIMAEEELLPAQEQLPFQNMMEEQQVEEEDFQWQFINTNFEETNPVAEFEANYKHHQQKLERELIEDQSSSDAPVAQGKEINHKDSLKIKDLLDTNHVTQVYQQPLIALAVNKQISSFDFSDYLNYDRAIFQHRKQQTRMQPKEIQLKSIERPEIEFPLSRFFEFSLRQVFNPEPAEQTIPQSNELDELIYQENVYFQDIQDEPHVEAQLENVQESMILEFQQESCNKVHTQVQVQVKQEIVVVTPLPQEIQQDQEAQQFSIKLEPQIKMLEEIETKLKKPYRVQFKVVLPEETQHQIPVKLLKQCVFKIIQPILDTKRSVSFSRIWLTLKHILPQCHQLITVGQLYIAVLFLCSEQQLILQRDTPTETEFTITRKQ